MVWWFCPFLLIFSTVLIPVSLSQSRRAHNIELKGAVVIFDEAHNVVTLSPDYITLKKYINSVQSSIYMLEVKKGFIFDENTSNVQEHILQNYWKWFLRWHIVEKRTFKVRWPFTDRIIRNSFVAILTFNLHLCKRLIFLAASASFIYFFPLSMNLNIHDLCHRLLWQSLNLNKFSLWTEYSP